LLRALQARCLDMVRRALEEDPEAATTPFFDNWFDPPVCSAVRSGCSAAIIRLLVQHRSDAEAVDCRGRNPMTLLASMRFTRNPVVGARKTDAHVMAPSAVEAKEGYAVALALIDAGMSPTAPDANGQAPDKVAIQAGNRQLTCLLQHCLGVRACTVLCRAWSAREASNIKALPGDVLKSICSYVVPDRLVRCTQW